jgi:hypothetical protein
MSRRERRVDSATPALLRRHSLCPSRSIMTERGHEERLYDRQRTLARVESQWMTRRFPRTFDRVLKFTFAIE